MPLLFSYGTLQREDVQRATFGRTLIAHPDQLTGFSLGTMEVRDPAFVATSGKAHHAIVRHTGNAEERVDGVALEVTDEELALADSYEPDGYVRVATTLVSGREAWVYASDGGGGTGDGR
jgi:hypothetical protein